MSLIEKMAEKALGQTEKKGQDWIVKAIKSGRKVLPEGDDPINKGLREAGNDALDELDKNKATLARVGHEGLVVLLSYTALGAEDKALELLRSGDAGWGDADAALTAAGDRTEQAKRDQELAKMYGEKGEIAFGYQIRSYVLYPYQLVRDERTELKVPNAGAVLDGAIQPFIDAALRLRLQTQQRG